MKTTPVALALLLLSLSAVALATPPGGSNEEVQGVTLVMYDQHGDKHTYLIKCANGARTVQDCRGPSIWEDDNDFGGLQTTRIWAGRWFEPDHRTLG